MATIGASYKGNPSILFTDPMAGIFDFVSSMSMLLSFVRSMRPRIDGGFMLLSALESDNLEWWAQHQHSILHSSNHTTVSKPEKASPSPIPCLRRIQQVLILLSKIWKPSPPASSHESQRHCDHPIVLPPTPPEKSTGLHLAAALSLWSWHLAPGLGL